MRNPEKSHYTVLLEPKKDTPSYEVWSAYHDKLMAANRAGKEYVASLGAENVTFRSPMNLVGAVFSSDSLPPAWRREGQRDGLTYACPKNTKAGREISSRLKELSFLGGSGDILEAEGICEDPDWKIIGHYSVMSGVQHLAKLDRFIILVPVENGTILSIPSSYSEISEHQYQIALAEHNEACKAEAGAL